jgi:hypothetical protein
VTEREKRVLRTALETHRDTVRECLRDKELSLWNQAEFKLDLEAIEALLQRLT